MEGEEGEGLRLSKRFSDNGGSGEVDYKTKAGTAWSHSYLNQKPWHPLSYPNQRRRWIAEQTHSQRERRAEEVAREYAQEQEFFRQAALVSKKEKEKLETMKAVSFMYVRPPGYNAESAKAAEIADDRKRQESDNPSQGQLKDDPATERPPESSVGEKKKPRPKDVFGRALPTEEEFEVLKNAPRMDTGVFARVKPFGVEVRNVKCVRCGIHGHQSGDRECPLKDAIMPNEESRLKRDDPLTTILAHADPSEPLKWELKQKPGISPPRGGFKPDDPNQQIVAEEIFDEYGGFLSGGVPELLSNFSSEPKKKKSLKEKSQRKFQPSLSRKGKDLEDEERISKKKHKSKRKKRSKSESSSDSETSEFDRRDKRNRHKVSCSSDDSDSKVHHRLRKNRRKHSYSMDSSDLDRHKRKQYCSESSSDVSDSGKERRQKHSCSNRKLETELEHRLNNRKIRPSEDSDFERNRRSDKSKSRHSSSLKNQRSDHHHSNSRMRRKSSPSSEDSEANRYRTSKGKKKHYFSSEDSFEERHYRGKPRKH